MTISDKILHLRKRSNFTQEELSEQLNVSRQSVSKWESGQSIPDIQKIMDMAKLFGVSTDYLLFDEVNEISGEPIPEKSEAKLVTIETANTYIEARRRFAISLSIAVFLIIIATIPFVISDHISEENPYFKLIYVWFFTLVSVGVAMIILSSSKLAKFEYINKGDFELSFNVSGLIREQKSKLEPVRTKRIVISVVMYILSVLPILLVGDERQNSPFMAVVLLIIGFSTLLLIRSETNFSSYVYLLHEDDEQITQPKEVRRNNAVMGAFWAIVLAIFLLWGFLEDDWSRSWLVWPVGGAISVALELILNRNNTK